MIRKHDLNARTRGFSWGSGPVYAYMRGDVGSMAKARARASSWGKKYRHTSAGDIRADADGDPKWLALLRPSMRIEREYLAQIRRLTAGPLRREMIRIFGPILRRWTNEAIGRFPWEPKPTTAERQAVLLAGVDRLTVAMQPAITATPDTSAIAISIERRATGAAANAARLALDGAAQQAAIRVIDAGGTAERLAQLSAWSVQQVGLVREITPAALASLSTKITEHVRAGTDVHTVARMIAKTEGYADFRASNIARTSTAQLNSTIAQDAMKRSGATSYVWRTAGDEAVREMHAELEGVVVRWDDPPVVAKDGRRAHAGFDYQCRCTAEPIYDEDSTP